ncbi:MAG: LpqB family beta-propeller domain-containing protein [Bryobacteraceae bacterium]|jgi:Tol biopolymer transport system component
MSSAAFFRRPAVVLMLGLCLIGGGVSILSRLASGPSTEPKRVALPHEGGAEAAPAFSPDGKRLAFSAREGGGNSPYHIRVRSVDGGAAAQLTAEAASDLGPAWSPDGASIAFLRVDKDRARYVVLPAAGGEPRQVADFPIPDPKPGPQPAVCWTRDAQSLYVVEWAEGQPPFIAAVSAAGGAMRRVTQPPAGSHGDSSPAISPGGATLAFVRQSSDRAEHDSDGGGSDIFLSDLSGNNLRRLTFEDTAIHGIAWSADGRDLIYAASRVAGEKLWRIDASGGSPRNVLAGGRDPAFPAVAPAGHRLAFTEKPALDAIWRIDLTAPDPASSARLLIRSNGREYAPAWSPDGKKIVNISTQTGSDEIWVGDADGNHRAPITHQKASRLDRPRWSPDGRTILFGVRGNGEIDVDRVASDGHTQPVRIPLPADSHQLSWSHDGQWIYFQSMAQVWKARADGQPRQKLTNNWGDGEPEESSDGQYVYFRRERSIWRIPAAGGSEEEVIAPDHETRWPAFQAAAAGLYYLELDRQERTVVLRFYDFQSKKSRELVRLPVTDASSISTFSVSPDGRYVLYPTVDRAQTALVLTENFR